jgi:hypothetical protein
MLDLLDILDSQSESSPTFLAALQQMESIANDGSLEAAEAIAEIFASSEIHRDPAKAYLWYHVALSAQGFSTRFDNQNETLEQYCGPSGDFRNEAQVNGLLAELDESRLHQLDAAASDWLHLWHPPYSNPSKT